MTGFFSFITYINEIFVIWELDWDLFLHTSLHLYNTFCELNSGGINDVAYTKNQPILSDIVDIRKIKS